MANTCVNFIQIFGSEKSIQIISNHLSTDKFDDHISVVGRSDIYDDGTSLDISAESRWSPPKELLQSLSSDYNLLIECEYEECGADIAGKFAYDKGKLVMNIEFSYLEGKYHFMDWNEFVECEVMFHLEDLDPFDEFMARFDFVSDEHRLELEELFFEHENDK
jgi:hypothetical protein